MSVIASSHAWADNAVMGLRFHRSIKLLPGIRLNFGKRGISTSIGVRGAHVTYGPSGTRTTVGLPGTGLSYTHLEKPHHGRPVRTAAEAPTGSAASPGSAGRGFLWIGLIVVVLVVAVGRLTTHAPPLQATLPQPVQTATQMAAQAAENEKAAETKRAVDGLAQIRHTVANSGSLKIPRVTVMPNGATCYQLRLKNSRGVAYVRTAVMDGMVLKVSGSVGFTELWNDVCAHGGGRDVTSAVLQAI
jgi:hypothetical protein